VSAAQNLLVMHLRQREEAGEGLVAFGENTVSALRQHDLLTWYFETQAERYDMRRVSRQTDGVHTTALHRRPSCHESL
jgi:hypothetical protein